MFASPLIIKMAMGKHGYYFLRRIAQSFFILWAISIVAFVIIHLAPGGPITVFEDPFISPETAHQINESLGLYEPIPVQYFRWLEKIVKGDFGVSLIDSRPVIEKIAERLPATLELGVVARLIGLLGIPLGVYAAVKRGSRVDNIIRVLTALSNATPHWWLALILLVFVVAPTGILPLGGMYTIGNPNNFVDHVWHLILPATISALGDWIVWSRYVRSQVLEVLGQDYIRTAYAKGLRRNHVHLRHVVPNAIIPTITILGDLFAIVISGSVILETVFSWPGIGRLAFLAAIQRDYPTIMALLMVTAFLTVFGNLFSDMLYSLADPRIEFR